MFSSNDLHLRVLAKKAYVLANIKWSHFHGIHSKRLPKSSSHHPSVVNDPGLDLCAASSAIPISFARATTSRDFNFCSLSLFNICFVIDNSGIMSARSWCEIKEAMKTMTSICMQHHVDGIEIYFLNGDDRKHITTPAEVETSFTYVQLRSGTTVGSKLHSILGSYLLKLRRRGKDAVKPLDIIVISDGNPGDDLKSVIVSVARDLDELKTLAWQVRIQLCQVGSNPEVGKSHEDLDASLAYQSERNKESRNVVAMIPWMKTLDGKAILTSALGAMERRPNNRHIWC